MEDEQNSIYRIAAKVKNLARGDDAHLTPVGEAMCNYYIIVLKDFYDFAEDLPGSYKQELIALIEHHYDMPGKLIRAVKPKKSTS